MIGGFERDEVDVESGGLNQRQTTHNSATVTDSVGPPATHVVWGKRRVAPERLVFGLTTAKLGFPILWSDSFRGIRGVSEPLLTW